MGEPLYHSPLGLFDFQALGVAECYFDLDNLPIWSTGIGKTHLAMALAAMLFEDGLIDQVVVAAEFNKVLDWVADFEKFTDLSVVRYAGAPARRARIRDGGLPQVIVGVYETLRNDLAHKNTKARYAKMADWLPGPLLETLLPRRCLLVYDEATKLGNRTSGNYKAQEATVKALRRAHPGETRTLALTATGFESSPEQIFNLGRIITPSTIGTVQEFMDHHVVYCDAFDKPAKFKNLGPKSEILEEGVPTLQSKLRPALKIKSKFDPDVIEQFPKKIEEIEFVELDPKHLDLYRTIEEAFYEQEWSEQEERQIFGVLRQLAGHPMAVSRSEGRIAKMITEQIGVAGLADIKCAKRDQLLHDIQRIKDQDGKAVVFTFYGQSILPLLHDDLRMKGFNVAINHGQMSAKARQESIEALRYGDADVFLTSDAGSKGLNLPEAHYVFNYEMPLTFSNYTQRNDRIHRIDSLANIVVTTSYIAWGTIEEGIAHSVLKGNEWSDTIFDDDDESGADMTADDRRAMIEFAKRKVAA